jgi:hypothetical protein
MYNVPPKELALFNKLPLDKGLAIGQTIRVPLTKENLLQSGNAATDEASFPLYYTVADKEGLYRISLNHNKVGMEELRKWNNLVNDNLTTGTPLIVGYLKVKKAASQLVLSQKREMIDYAKKPDVNPGPPDVYDGPLPPVKNNDNKIPTVPIDPPLPPKPVQKNEPILPVITKGTGDNFNGGIFKELYESQKGNLVKESGTAGVFKSTSGWEDGKYYCLHNAAAPGTIIQVTNQETGKSIYAKVLDAMPDIKQNAGLIIRISNAAAEILGVGENKFVCTNSYVNAH